jgi:acyl-CoA synthetase (AMP-forming)/AMP-acid ligase II
VDQVGEFWIRGRVIFGADYKRPEANAGTAHLFRCDADGFYDIGGLEMADDVREDWRCNNALAYLGL